MLLLFGKLELFMFDQLFELFKDRNEIIPVFRKMIQNLMDTLWALIALKNILNLLLYFSFGLDSSQIPKYKREN